MVLSGMKVEWVEVRYVSDFRIPAPKKGGKGIIVEVSRTTSGHWVALVLSEDKEFSEVRLRDLKFISEKL